MSLLALKTEVVLEPRDVGSLQMLKRQGRRFSPRASKRNRTILTLNYRTSLVAQMVKRMPTMQETWVGKVPGEGNGNPLQYPCLENPMDGGAW